MSLSIELRGAIPPHSTPTSDRSWDGPANERRLREGESPSYYRRAYAWQDPDEDGTAKAHYRFIHHEVDADGNIGPANVQACITGIAILNGARGVDVEAQPWARDRRGIYEHLARHIRDAGREPPELREITFDPHGRERRSLPLERLEIREEEGGPRKIVGYAAVFEQLSEPLFGGFREKIARGAFRKTLKEADVRALWNHDPNYVLGRTKSGTLRLQEDDRGLAIEIDPPDTQWARDLLTSIARGDVDQMSFGFRVIKDDWDRQPDGTIIRTLREVELFDVSPVTFPAYPQTSVQVRDILRSLTGPSRPEGHSTVALLRRRLRLMEGQL